MLASSIATYQHGREFDETGDLVEQRRVGLDGEALGAGEAVEIGGDQSRRRSWSRSQGSFEFLA